MKRQLAKFLSERVFEKEDMTSEQTWQRFESGKAKFKKSL